MIGYEGLEEWEKDFVRAIMHRCGCAADDIDAVLPCVRIVRVIQEPFIMVSLQWPSTPATYGFAKQCTYRPTEDEWDKGIGLKIAISRAVRNWKT